MWKMCVNISMPGREWANKGHVQSTLILQFGGLALASLTKAERGSNSGIGKPGAGRIPNPLIGTNTGPQGLGSNFDGITNDNKVTWDHNTGTIGSDNEDRNKGYLDRTQNGCFSLTFVYVA